MNFEDCLKVEDRLNFEDRLKVEDCLKVEDLLQVQGFADLPDQFHHVADILDESYNHNICKHYDMLFHRRNMDKNLDLNRDFEDDHKVHPSSLDNLL